MALAMLGTVSPMLRTASTLLKPLAISRPTGTTTAVPAPTTARTPTGTVFSTVQNMLQRSQTAPSSSIFSMLRQRLAPKPPAAPAPAAPQPQPPAPNVNVRPMIGPTVPSVTPGTPNIAPAAPPKPPAQPASGTQAYGATITDLTGNERPQAITPSGSATDALQQQAQDAASRALANPSAFDDDLFKAEVGRARESLDADLANRGLDYSTIAPQLFSDRVLSPLLSERARTISSDRANALAGAQSVIGQRTGLEAQGREELRGERGYNDTLREQARQNAIQDYQLGEGQFQQTLAQALASGDPTRALAALQSAAYGMGGPAAAYGQQAENTGASLQDLASQFLQQFYGSNAK